MNAVREQLLGGHRASCSWPTSKAWRRSTSTTAMPRATSCSASWARILGRRGTAGRLGGDALALWAAVPATTPVRWPLPCATTSSPACSTDGVTVDVVVRPRLGTCPATTSRRCSDAAGVRARAVPHARGPLAERGLGGLRSRTGARSGGVCRPARRARMGVGQAPGSRRRTRWAGVAQRQAVAGRARGLRARGSSSSPGHQPRQSGRLSSSKRSAQTSAAMPMKWTRTVSARAGPPWSRPEAYPGRGGTS